MDDVVIHCDGLKTVNYVRISIEKKILKTGLHFNPPQTLMSNK